MKTQLKVTRRTSPAVLFATALAWYLAIQLPLALATHGCWIPKADMPMAVGAAASCEAEGILYVAGGETLMGNPVQTLFAYNPQTDTWARRADLPTARMSAVASAVDGIVYVIGGGSIQAEKFTGTVEAYHPKTDTWAVKTPMPTARGAMAACTVEGRIYVIGGYLDGLAEAPTVECYDPQTDQWMRKAPVPAPARVPVAQVVNDTIYVFTEKSAFSYNPTTDRWTRKAALPAGAFYCHGTAGGAVDGVVYLLGGLLEDSSMLCGQTLTLAYDPVQDRFTSGGTMPQPCILPSSTVMGGRIYIAGGLSGHPTRCPGAVYYQSLWVFDPHGVPPGSWTRKQDMPVALGASAGCAVGGILYIAGGEEQAGSPQKTMLAYDPEADGWTRKADMPTARAVPVAGAVDGIVYVIGGGNVIAKTYTKAVEAYDPNTDTWTAKTPMPTARGDMTACAVDGLIYVMGGLTIGSEYTATVECYDPHADRWTRKTSLPEVCAASAAQAVNGAIYLFERNSTFAYDPKTDRWTRMNSIPAASFSSANSMAGVVDGMVYLCGGLGENPYCAEAHAIAYDPDRDRFTGRRTMPAPCAAAASATIGDRVYVAGGISGHPTMCPTAAYSKKLWVFNPQGGVPPRILSFIRPSNDTVRLIWEGDVGRRYRLHTTANPAKGPWVPLTLPGGPTILASKAVVETTAPVAPADTARFFRLSEAE